MKPTGHMQIVPAVGKTVRITDWEAKLTKMRAALLRAAVLYVRTCQGNRGERLRQASEWTGIPVNYIDIEERKG